MIGVDPFSDVYVTYIKICCCDSISRMNNMNTYVKTHTYWMTTKEYIRWSKNQPVQVHFNSKNNTTDKDRQLVTRTHIFFV